ncbi:YdcF family protein [Paucibacter soli]|uniref:YdcF family protein n=1 Tax=Paucibacter soli TaxID=3133433 RepID=UPI0030A4FC3E
MIALESLASGLRSMAQALSLPPAPLLFLVLLAWLLRQRAKGWARALLVIGLSGAWLSCTEVGAVTAARLLLGEQVPALQWPLPTPSDPRVAEHTAILVLGAGARQDVPEVRSGWLKPLSIERLNYGAWLAKQAQLPLAFTGGLSRNGKPGDQSEAELAEAYARELLGLRLQWLEDQAKDTRDNARYSAALLKPTGLRRLVLVTHVQHMPRALHHFRLAFGAQVELIAAPVGLRAPDAPLEALDWLPSSEGLARTRYAVYEWLALRLGH